jgi:lipid II:glycine glycyltransferase (peptidoglycan interpeptide bridge formation enzyme)
MPLLITVPARSCVDQIRPLKDLRWDEFVLQSPNSSIFHTRAWLEALQLTYGYEPVAFTIASSSSLIASALVFCRVDSWLTGRRLVSLPFSDHCDPLVREPAEFRQLFSAVEREVAPEQQDYLELRPLTSLDPHSTLPRSEYSYYSHQLDLRPELNTLFRGFHKDCTQRMIRRAERVGLTYEEGRSASLLDAFYRLLVMTRRRKRVPPQPKRWFENLSSAFGNRLKIRVALKDGEPGAAIVTIRFKETLVYKYGGSDPRFHRLGAMQLLFWKCIQEGKQEGARVLDMGRSNISDSGLIAFKDRWGCTRSKLTYSRFGLPGRFEYRRDGGWQEHLARTGLSLLPRSLFVEAGRLLYRHVG